MKHIEDIKYGLLKGLIIVAVAFLLVAALKGWI